MDNEKKRMSLKEYKAKRNLKQTKEPSGKAKKTEGFAFVVQRHDASHLHYDFRLELDGVLKSWAVPKGPPSVPAEKRLSVMVEDHPYEYRKFEGVIPEGNYGAGTVKIWDEGTFYPLDENGQKAGPEALRSGLKKGKISFVLEGKKLKGSYSLIKMKGGKKDNEWLWLKSGKQVALPTKTKLEKRAFEFTHLDKIYFPKEKITKGMLIEYYHEMAHLILPYLIDRPESLRRFPNGIDKPGFFQKNVDKSFPSWINTFPVQHHEGITNYLLVQDEKSLLFAVNLGCIDFNPFNSRIETLQNPDYLILDLDPEAIDFKYVIKTAQAIHAVLEEVKIPSFCKTSGSRGLHIYVPMGAKYTYEQTKDFAHLVAEIVHKRVPDFTSLERNPKKRQKKVYIDYLQNNFGQTLAAPYSVRPKPGATVSTPLEWSEVTSGMTPQDFTYKNIFARVKKKGDLFKPVLKKGIDLSKMISSLKKIF